MTKLLDLSHPYQHGMPVFPGDPEVVLTQTAELRRDGWTSFLLTAGLHAGTHLDAPLHRLAEGKSVADLPIECFVKPGVLVDARGCGEADEKLLLNLPIEAGSIVLLLTGHSSKYQQPDYYQSYPTVSREFADQLIDRGVGILGLDTPSPDRTPYLIHDRLLSCGVLLLENLTSLEKLVGVEKFDVIALPLAICAEASPVRVIARWGSE